VQAAAVDRTPPSTVGTLGDKYAVVEVGGSQQIVEEEVKFPRVVAVKEGGEMSYGEPYLEDATVEAEIVEEYRGKKIIVFKYRPKKHYRKIRGHRQEMTRFRVTKISKG